MPCNDVTDRLKMTISDDNRVVAYTLAKRTCGAEVGEYSLIEPWVKDRTIDDILTTSPDIFFETVAPKDTTEEFLVLKHFFSIRNGLEAFTGRPAVDGEPEKCLIDRVEYGPEGTLFVASIKLDIITNQIKSCGGCSRGRSPSCNQLK